jgi:hypothetical protein
MKPLNVKVALGKRPHVTIFGSDYETPDGTGKEQSLLGESFTSWKLLKLRFHMTWIL